LQCPSHIASYQEEEKTHGKWIL